MKNSKKAYLRDDTVTNHENKDGYRSSVAHSLKFGGSNLQGQQLYSLLPVHAPQHSIFHFLK